MSKEGYICNRCGHKWQRRKKVEPVCCPKCKSPYWNEVKEIMENISELQKYIVLLLNSNDAEPLKGDLWFQKELFLTDKNIPELASEASFCSDFLGPYSENAEEQVEQLEQDEIINKEGNKLSLSPLGNKIAQEIKIDKEHLEMISEFKSLLNDLTNDELLTLIYFSFQNMTDESLKLKHIIKHRISVAIKLYKKNKITIQKASEIAGISLENFSKRVER